MTSTMSTTTDFHHTRTQNYRSR